MNRIYHNICRRLPSRRRLTSLLLGAAMLISGSVQAEIFCVNTPTGIQNALINAADNSESDEIRVVFGSYEIPTGPTSGFQYSSSQPGGLTISGGWGPPSMSGGPICESRKDDPRITTFDGLFKVEGLVFEPGAETGDIIVENLTITQGSSLTNGGGLSLVPGNDDWQGNLSIRTVRFLSNEATNDGAGLYAVVRNGDFELVNSVFFQNGAGDDVSVADIYVDGPSAVIANNSVVNNVSGGASGSGMRVSGTTAALMINNLFFDNGFDFNLNNDGVTLRHNFYNSRLGEEPAEESGILSGNPVLVTGSLGLGPFLGSPLIDNGLLPVPADLPERDAEAGQRIIGQRIDIGAIEAQIFGDGAEGDDDWTVPTAIQE